MNINIILLIIFSISIHNIFAFKRLSNKLFPSISSIKMTETSTTSSNAMEIVKFNDIQKYQNFHWQQTMLRIKDPSLSIPFYEKNFGFQLYHKYDFPQWGFALYFLGIPLEEEVPNLPKTIGGIESEDYIWHLRSTCLELTHNYGSENDDNFQVNNGNVEPFRGFGHIAVMTRDVYTACDELEANGCKFQKKPDEGKMKGIAFVLDPDGYWIEVVSRSANSPVSNKFTLAQTMIRVKDPKKSIKFYRDLLGMTLVSERHLGVGEDWGFSLYFLACIPEGSQYPHPTSNETSEFIKQAYWPVLELTHNHGTESKREFKLVLKLIIFSHFFIIIV